MTQVAKYIVKVTSSVFICMEGELCLMMLWWFLMKCYVLFSPFISEYWMWFNWVIERLSLCLSFIKILASFSGSLTNIQSSTSTVETIISIIVWITFHKTMIQAKYSSSLYLLNTIIQNMFNSPKNAKIHHWHSRMTTSRSIHSIHPVTKWGICHWQYG